MRQYDVMVFPESRFWVRDADMNVLWTGRGTLEITNSNFAYWRATEYVFDSDVCIKVTDGSPDNIHVAKPSGEEIGTYPVAQVKESVTLAMYEGKQTDLKVFGTIS